MRVSRMTKLGIAVLLLSAGCSADLKQENALLALENEDLRFQLADRNTALNEAREDVRERNLQIAQFNRDMGQQPLGQVTGFEDIPNVSAAFEAGQVTVTVESDVLFASGKATIKSTAKRSLDLVATVLNRSYEGRPIRVSGHTDTDPIRKSGHKSNYHLGFERAYAVREYLASRGVEPTRLSLASYGPDRPQSTKAQSRRVEIIVVME